LNFVRHLAVALTGCAVLAAICGSPANLVSAAGASYTVKTIGPAMASGYSMDPLSINSSGQVVGQISHSVNGVNYEAPFAYESGKVLKPRIPAGYTSAEFTGIDNVGAISATATTATNKPYAFAIRRNSSSFTWTLLKGPQGQKWQGSAVSINSQGTMTGYLDTPGQRVAVWRKQATGYVASLLPATTFNVGGGNLETAVGYGTSIDGSGDVSGNQIVDIPNGSGGQSAYLGSVWLPSGKSVILPGYAGSEQQTDARGIGESGTGSGRTLTVAGSVLLNDGMWHPCTWKVVVNGSSLAAKNPVLSKQDMSDGYWGEGGNNAINPSGTEAVGSIISGPYSWQTGKDIIELSAAFPPSSGWDFSYTGDATAVNDKGVVVGYGSHNGRQAGFMATPAG